MGHFETVVEILRSLQTSEAIRSLAFNKQPELPRTDLRTALLPIPTISLAITRSLPIATSQICMS